MNPMRSALLKASQSAWLRERATRYGFVRRSARRFLPGEDLEAALATARALAESGIATLITHLGENVTDRAEAESATAQYLDALERIHAAGLASELSVKLTQLGLDFDSELCFANLTKLMERSRDRTLWIDMEQAPYVDMTLEIYRRARENHHSAGICVQSYLYRTEQDLESLIPLGGAVRLVKGAYREPAEIAFPKKKDVDENYFRLAQTLLDPEARRTGARVAFATHDGRLIARIAEWAASQEIAKDELEFAMLYGIQRSEQLRLAREGYCSCVLVSYGTYWFPWFMRRLAERPANILFLIRNLFS